MRKNTFAVSSLILALAVGLSGCSAILHPLIFYGSAENGRLYDKEGTLVTGFVYHDRTFFD